MLWWHPKGERISNWTPCNCAGIELETRVTSTSPEDAKASPTAPATFSVLPKNESYSTSIFIANPYSASIDSGDKNHIEYISTWGRLQ
jgi:hypothetical protein